MKPTSPLFALLLVLSVGCPDDEPEPEVSDVAPELRDVAGDSSVDVESDTADAVVDAIDAVDAVAETELDQRSDPDSPSEDTDVTQADAHDVAEDVPVEDEIGADIADTQPDPVPGDADVTDTASDLTSDEADLDTEHESDSDPFDPCAGSPCTEPNRNVCVPDGHGGYTCSCNENYQDNNDNGTCLEACSMAALECHEGDGQGMCSDESGVAFCECVFPWTGPECNDCEHSYEPSDGTCQPVAEYVIKELGAGGRYTYRPDAPWPSDIRDEIWDGYPFPGVDSAARLEESDGYWGELFTYGNHYTVLIDETWKTCPTDPSCAAGSVPTHAPMCPGGIPDAYWGTGFPFCDGIDTMTQWGEGDAGIWVATRGEWYVQYTNDFGYHHYDGDGVRQNLEGRIDNGSWDSPDGANFPFESGIDAMVDFFDDGLGEDRFLFVKGDEAVICSVEMVCTDTFVMGSEYDPFFPHLWQTLPFAEVEGWDDPVHALLRSGYSGRAIFIIHNGTPLPRPEITGSFRLLEAFDEQYQRALILSGTSFEQGFAQGYLLGEEILTVLNEVIVPHYNTQIDETVAIADGATGYQAARNLWERFDFSDDYGDYPEELEGMLAGIQANHATNGYVFDGAYEEPLEVADLMAMQLVDDLWGVACKSATVWPETDGPTIDHPWHISIIDWDTALGPFNLVVAYDNSGDAVRMSWIGPSWSGNTGGWLFGLNEAGAAYSYVSSGGELRWCPSGVTNCFDERFTVLDGIDLRSTAFVTRRSFEQAGTIDEAWALLDGVSTMTVSSFTMTQPAPGDQSGTVFELIYPGIETVWAATDYIFHTDDSRPYQQRRGPDPAPGDGSFEPVVVAADRVFDILTVPAGEPEPAAYNALRDGLRANYPDTVNITTLTDVVDDMPPTAPHTTQITIGEIIVGEAGNQSAIDTFFSGGSGNIWAGDGSHGHHTWPQLFEGTGTE